MFIELVETLRCLAPHEESWLVASIDRMSGRHIEAGTLGCPVCRAEYPVRDGVVFFVPDGQRANDSLAATDDDVIRIAAALDLTTPGMVVLIDGIAMHEAIALALQTDVRMLLLNPSGRFSSADGVSPIVADTIPLRANTVNGAAFTTVVNAQILADAARALRPGGRLYAPAELALPDGVTELARDDRAWVAERSESVVPSGIVSIGRRRGS